MEAVKSSDSSKMQPRNSGKKRNHDGISTTITCRCGVSVQRSCCCHCHRLQPAQRCYESESLEGWLCGRKETSPREETMLIAPKNTWQGNFILIARTPHGWEAPPAGGVRECPRYQASHPSAAFVRSCGLPDGTGAGRRARLRARAGAWVTADGHPAWAGGTARGRCEGVPALSGKPSERCTCALGGLA